jgi:hypothetical protein
MVRECSPPAREPTGHYFRDSADLRQLAFYYCLLGPRNILRRRAIGR